MSFVACIVPVSPMRRESAHRSEMVSQLLFGETAEVLETTRDFTRVRGLADQYEGWCQSSQLTAVADTVAGVDNQLSASWVTTLHFNGKPMQVPLGSSLGAVAGEGKIGSYGVGFTGKAYDTTGTAFDTTALVAFAQQYLNTPYLWGGRSVFGIDCSGFAQQVFRFFGKALPRDSYQQAALGELVGFLQEAKEADLAFFDNEEGKIIHVGILMGTDTIIHSSGKVRIDKIDSMGIVNTDTGERTHKLRIIKRIV